VSNWDSTSKPYPRKRWLDIIAACHLVAVAVVVVVDDDDVVIVIVIVIVVVVVVDVVVVVPYCQGLSLDLLMLSCSNVRDLLGAMFQIWARILRN
jgi:hypothetical protein